METKRATDIHTSQFLITLNSNSADEKWASEMSTALEEWFDNIEAYLKATQPELVDHISEPTAACELGKKYKRWHCHLFFRVEHRTKCQINIHKSYEFFRQRLQRDIYFNVKWIKDYQASVLNYLRKEMPNAEEAANKFYGKRK